MPLNGLAGKTVIVTGAAQGIGRAYARRFRDEGCRVVLADVNADKGRGVLAELTDAGANAIFCTTDVSSEASCKQMVDEALKAFGHVDVLINNAAIFSTIQMKPFWEMSVAEWDGLMAVNLKGVWLAGKACSAPMREQKSGSIVNISSAAYLLARPGYAHYMASKAGVLGLTRAMARELGEFGVRVNAITPGPVYTEIPRATVTPEQKEAMLKMQCLRRHEAPQDLVGVAAFLASDDAGFITGQTINCDGGLAFI
jgi:NAD(P)-dependent dehydrogenase (short-subunit alcohol dehydrogenase family)